ncbi:MAG: enoyl-CoA hydratase/isomerase family protein [Betaproteobacteria bacterium]|nr:enoyl-CoA hydratase/isomerase family protein [Betaproteobacteria bacterium]
MNVPIERDELALETRDGIAWITFNRPQKANALTAEMMHGLERALAACEADAAARALVLSGAGTRVFSAGADLTVAPEDARSRRARFAAALLALLDFSKPSVAAVNGAACGAGMMLALACDAMVIAESARFSLPEITKGQPTLPGITIVSQRFGSAVAADLSLSGRFVGAEEAFRRGFAPLPVASGELADRARELALALGRHDASVYAQDKRWLNRALRKELVSAIKASTRLRRS